MDLYLSSFGFGDQVDSFKAMASGRTIGFVPNAFDSAEPQIRVQDGLKPADDPLAIPYSDREPVWEGLGILDYLILPHFQSNHPESASIDQAVAYCQNEGIRFRTLRDGDVIILEAFRSAGSV
ncbi:MAG TPA: hypothetical protein VE201_09350 [Nitrospirales bacterium]|nr:hypothetical protein [Nitrospirales bacterium]